MGALGFEHSKDSSRNHGASKTGGAISGAVGAKGAESTSIPDMSIPSDPDMAELAKTWPKLPDAIKAGIMAMIRSTGGR